MKKAQTNRHLKFAVLATDVALFTLKHGELLVRLISVNRPPYFINAKGMPGGLIDPKETAESAALRQIKAKAQVDPSRVYVEQLATFSEVNRDPRGRVVAVAYLALIPWEKLSEIEKVTEKTTEKNSSQNVWWQDTRRMPKLAYDHDEIFEVALKRLKSRITYTTLIKKLLPDEFTLTELEKAFEAVIKKDIDKRNFRRKFEKLKLLEPLKRERRGQKARPAQLFTFKSKKIEEIEVL
jgi:8-oxo-dGTP diphosphatase